MNSSQIKCGLLHSLQTSHIWKPGTQPPVGILPTTHMPLTSTDMHVSLLEGLCHLSGPLVSQLHTMRVQVCAEVRHDLVQRLIRCCKCVECFSQYQIIVGWVRHVLFKIWLVRFFESNWHHHEPASLSYHFLCRPFCMQLT